jgi:hypothetical protein
MENIKLTDPISNKEIEIEISPVGHNHQQAWRIIFKDGESALVGLNQHGIWEQLDGSKLDSGLMMNIGKAIENQQASSKS